MTDARRPTANDNDGPVFTMTRGELEALVNRAVGVALSLRSGLAVLVDKQDLARQIGVSASQIDRLRKLGLPSLKVGESVRFEPAKVMAWLAERVTA